jgi:hypothetical protein
MPQTSGSSVRRIAKHEQRIANLENSEADRSRVQHEPMTRTRDHLPSPATQVADYRTPSSAFSMDRLDLEAPIATLRALGGIDQSNESTARPSTACSIANSIFDPVARSIVSEADAQMLVDM